MIDTMYHLLESIGFVHPLHPAMTHIPMGMAMGGFVFALIFYLMEKEEFLTTAYYSVSLGLVGIFPTVLFGFTDWQYRFGGVWNVWIVIKMILAVALTLGFILAIKFSLDSRDNHKKILFIYGLCLLFAIGLGFSGGELQYG